MTKNEIIKALKTEKERQLNILSTKNNEEVEKLKKQYLKETFKNEIEELNRVGVEYAKAFNSFIKKVNEQRFDIGFDFYYSVTSPHVLFRNASEITSDGLVDVLYDNSYTSTSTKVYNLMEEILSHHREVEEEWDKLIALIKSMSLKEAKKYLEENKIDIPELEDSPKEKALVSYNVDVAKLFIKEEV